MTDNSDTRIKRLGYRAPADVAEPDQLVLVEYASGGRVAVITLNRSHADNDAKPSCIPHFMWAQVLAPFA